MGSGSDSLTLSKNQLSAIERLKQTPLVHLLHWLYSVDTEHLPRFFHGIINFAPSSSEKGAKLLAENGVAQGQAVTLEEMIDGYYIPWVKDLDTALAGIDSETGEKFYDPAIRIRLQTLVARLVLEILPDIIEHQGLSPDEKQPSLMTMLPDRAYSRLLLQVMAEHHRQSNDSFFSKVLVRVQGEMLPSAAYVYQFLDRMCVQFDWNEASVSMLSGEHAGAACISKNDILNCLARGVFLQSGAPSNFHFTVHLRKEIKAFKQFCETHADSYRKQLNLMPLISLDNKSKSDTSLIKTPVRRRTLRVALTRLRELVSPPRSSGPKRPPALSRVKSMNDMPKARRRFSFSPVRVERSTDDEPRGTEKSRANSAPADTTAASRPRLSSQYSRMSESRVSLFPAVEVVVSESAAQDDKSLPSKERRSWEALNLLETPRDVSRGAAVLAWRAKEEERGSAIALADQRSQFLQQLRIYGLDLKGSHEMLPGVGTFTLSGARPRLSKLCESTGEMVVRSAGIGFRAS